MSGIFMIHNYVIQEMICFYEDNSLSVSWERNGMKEKKTNVLEKALCFCVCDVL